MKSFARYKHLRQPTTPDKADIDKLKIMEFISFQFQKDFPTTTTYQMEEYFSLFT